MSGLAALAGLAGSPSASTGSPPAPADDPTRPLDLTGAPFPNLSTEVIRADDKKHQQLERGRRR
jgi:hypothetical protein